MFKWVKYLNMGQCGHHLISIHNSFPPWPHLAIFSTSHDIIQRLLSKGKKKKKKSLTTNSTCSPKIKFMKPQIIILPMITIPCSWRRKIFVTQVQFNNGSECSYNDHFNSVPGEHVRLNSALNGKHSWSTLLSWREGRSWQARAWARRWVEGDEKDQRDDPDSQPSLGPCSSSLCNQVSATASARCICRAALCISTLVCLAWRRRTGPPFSSVGLSLFFFFYCSSYLLRKWVSWSRVECPITQIWALLIVLSVEILPKLG